MSDQSQGGGWWLASDGRYYPPVPATEPTPVPSAAAAPALSATGPTPPDTIGAPSPQPSRPGLVLRVSAAVLLVVGLITGGVLIAIPGLQQPDPLSSSSSSYDTGTPTRKDPNPYAGEGALVIYLALTQFVLVFASAPLIARRT